MHAKGRDQSGFSLLEAMVVVGLLGLVVLVFVSVAAPWMTRERVRSAVANIQGTLQVNRMEAVKRSRPCRFILDTGQKTVEVWDGMGTVSAGDDVLLHSARLPETVEFVDPEGGAAVTLAAVGTSAFEVIFDSDGTIGSGDGDVFLAGGGIYRRVTLQVAGGIRVTRWNGSGWEY